MRNFFRRCLAIAWGCLRYRAPFAVTHDGKIIFPWPNRESAMTVGELRKLLDALPDDLPILTYDDGYLLLPTRIPPVECAPIEERGTVLRIIDEHSGHPAGTRGKRYLVIS